MEVNSRLHVLAALPPEKIALYPLKSRLYGIQGQSGQFEKEKKFFSSEGRSWWGGGVLPPPQTAESKGDGKINVRNEQI
jgi:hypothetical protein